MPTTVWIRPRRARRSDDTDARKEARRCVGRSDDTRKVARNPDKLSGGLVNGRVLGPTPVKEVKGAAEATFTVEFFARGNFTFNVQYLGSSRFQGSICNTMTVNVF